MDPSWVWLSMIVPTLLFRSLRNAKALKGVLLSAARKEHNSTPSILRVCESPFALITQKCSDHRPIYFIVALATIPIALSTKCEDTNANDNPLWPSGISNEDVDFFIDGIMKDPTINIPGIPDYIEKMIYTSTVRLILNMVYSNVAQLHGCGLFAHQFQLRRYEEPKSAEMQEEHLNLMRGTAGIDETILEEVADRLLANKAVNNILIPDFIERQLYVNCLKLVFRVLDTIAASFRITVCGHDIRLHIEPSSITAVDRGALIKAAAYSLTKVDIEAVQAFARQAGVHDVADDAGFLQRIFDPSRKEFVAQLHASLYALILGILDDLLANTELELLSDRIRVDIVPCGIAISPQVSSPPAKEQAIVSQQDVTHAKFSPILNFSVGVGVGAVLMSFASRR